MLYRTGDDGMGSYGELVRRARRPEKAIGLLGLVALWLLSTATLASAQGAVRRPLAPTLKGPQGLFRTVSAEILPTGSLSLSLYGEFFQADGFAFPDNTTRRMVADLNASWSPYDFDLLDQHLFTEASIHWFASAVEFDDTASPPQTALSEHLIQVSAFDFYFKTSKTQVVDDEKELFSYGLGLGVFVPSKVDEIGIDFGQTSVQIDLLFTTDFAAENDDWPPVKLHANVGYFLSNISATKGFLSGGPLATETNTILRFAMGQSVYDQIRIRLGAEYVHRRFTPFLEYGMDGILDLPPGIGFLDSPQWLTPGLRIRPSEAWNISLGVEIALAQAANPTVSVLPDWNAILGVSYTFIPTPPPPPPPLIEPKERPVALVTTGRITGVVYDTNTNLPVGGAVISFPDRNLSSLLTDPEGGSYTTFELPAGPVEMRVSKQGYIARTASPVVVAGQTVTQDFYLVPEVVEAAVGTFRGTVQSADGEFLAAKVGLFGTEESRNTEPGVGQFVFELQAGEFRATAEAEGYLPETFTFALEGGQVLIHDFVLKKKPVLTKKKFVQIVENRIEISQTIYFATGKARILEQSFPVLREIADTIKESPQILLVEVGGHTDTRGNDEYNKRLSQERANAVREFLIGQGVESERLTAVGYGEQVPLVYPDDTNEKQARNRRVEFVILKQQ